MSLDHHDKRVAERRPVVDKLGVAGGIADTHMGSRRGAETGAPLSDLAVRVIDRHPMDIGPAAEAAGIGGKAGNRRAAVPGVVHLGLLLLQEVDPQWRGTRIGRTLTAGGGGVDTPDEPLSGRLALRGEDVLIISVDEDDVVKEDAVRQQLEILPLHNILSLIVPGEEDVVEGAYRVDHVNE